MPLNLNTEAAPDGDFHQKLRFNSVGGVWFLKTETGEEKRFPTGFTAVFDMPELVTGWSRFNGSFLDFVADHPQLEESVSVAKAVGKTIKVGSSPIAVAHYLIVESGAPDAAVADFFEVVRTGLGLTKKGDARYVLREFFRDGSFRNLSGPASHTAILSAVILAWNAFKADRRARTVKIDPGATIPAVEAW